MNISVQLKEKITYEAQLEFNQKRVIELSKVLFPIEQHHPKFKELLQKYLKFNSKRQMRILDGTWMNMCTFNREFFYPEMEVCLEILSRVTPNESVNTRDAIDWYEKNKSKFVEKNINLDLNTDQIILLFYNDVVYPEIIETIKDMKALQDSINNEISSKIADKITAEKKIKYQIPVGLNIKFIDISVTG